MSKGGVSVAYQQYVIALCELKHTIACINNDYINQHKKEPFTMKDHHAIDAGIDALKALDDMGNTMKKLLTERSNSYETVL